MAEAGPRRGDLTVGHGADDPDRSAPHRGEHCRTNHHEILVSAANVADLLPQIVWYLEEPLGQMETIQMYLNYREAARFVKVLLIGEGADECFAGYDRYRLLQPRLPLPLSVRKDLYERVYMYASEPPRTIAAGAGRLAWGTRRLAASDRIRRRAALGGHGSSARLGPRWRTIQQTYLHHLALKRADALGMRTTGAPCPVLDRRVVEFAARIRAL